MALRTALPGLAALASAAAAKPPTDPRSLTIDPPPAEKDYIGAMPKDAWMFGRLLRQGREPCSADACEAAYNADPLFLLVRKQANCCGAESYSVTIVATAKSCGIRGYYLFSSQQVLRWTEPERLALIRRHVGQLAAGMRSKCPLPAGAPIPTAELGKLFVRPSALPNRAAVTRVR